MDLPPFQNRKAPSPLAQAFQKIQQPKFAILPASGPGAIETVLNYPMWSAAANLTMGEYARMRRLKREYESGVGRKG
jgi:hypothetical protein